MGLNVALCTRGGLSIQSGPDGKSQQCFHPSNVWKILPFLSISFHPHLSSLKRGLLSQAIPCRKVLYNLEILFNKDFQGQSLSNFKLYDDERQGQRVHEMVCFNRTKWNPYMQKTCDVAGKAILAKINLRKKCVNCDKM